MTAPPATPRAGLGVLLYGDDRFERDYITAVLAARSIAVVGPFADVPGALQAVDAPGLCAAVIAYPHGGTAARGLAGALARRGIPYLTLTRATHSTVADDRPFLTRPFAAHQVADWVAGALAAAPPP